MKLITKIACRTLGTVGIAAACYNAFNVSKHYVKPNDEHCMEHCPNKDCFKPANAVNKKCDDYPKTRFQEKMSRIKCGIKGFILGLSNAVPLAACSSFAILCDNIWAKAGALGVGIVALHKISQEDCCSCKNNAKH